MNEKTPNNKYARNKQKAIKRASLDHEICSVCGGEFIASHSFEKDMKCELTWVKVKGKTVLVCEKCKKEREST